MDLSIRTETFGQGNQQWLGSAHGTDMLRPVTLDVSAFTAGTYYPEGYFPSGTPLSLLPSGLYGPYLGVPSEVQTITINATGGTWTATFEGGTTAALAFDATAAQVQTALEALANVQPGDVSVTKAGSVYTVTFTGKYAGENVTAMTTNAASLTGGAGTAVVATTTAGGSANGALSGFLMNDVKAPVVNTTDVAGALFEHGRVILAALPFAIDASGQADLAGRVWFI